MTLSTGVLYQWDGATWEIVNPQPHPYFFYDTDTGFIYDVEVGGTPPSVVDGIEGDVIINGDGSGDVYTSAGSTWDVCDMNGDLCIQLGELSIDCFGDVNVTGASENDYLCYNGTQWIPQQVPMNVWTSFTPVFRATTTNPTLGTNTQTAHFTADGGTMEVKLLYTQFTVGTAGSGNYRLEIPLPGTFNIDTTVAPALTVLGNAEFVEGTGGGATGGIGPVRVVDATQVEVNVHSEGDNSIALWGAGRFDFANEDLRVSMSFRVPIIRL